MKLVKHRIAIDEIRFPFTFLRLFELAVNLIMFSKLLRFQEIDIRVGLSKRVQIPTPAFTFARILSQKLRIAYFPLLTSYKSI